MATFRRALVPGGSYFFTAVTHRRLPLLTIPEVRAALRAAIRSTQLRYPFEQDAIVLLPDHLHAIWTLPTDDCDYSRRWSLIKRQTSQAVRAASPALLSSPAGSRQESGLWQRRFWEHLIRDEADYEAHMHYLHFNPVKHGLAAAALDWPHSSFHRWVKAGVYAADWGLREADSSAGFGEPL